MPLTGHQKGAYARITGPPLERWKMVVECTCSALRMAARRLSQLYDANLAPEGLNVSQYALLGNLAKHGGDRPPTMGDLAALLGLDRTTLAHNLRPLERDGLVAVAPDAGDARVRRVTLTAAGRAKRDRCHPLWHAAQERFEASFGADAARGLRRTLLAVAREAGAASPSEGV